MRGNKSLSKNAEQVSLAQRLFFVCLSGIFSSSFIAIGQHDPPLNFLLKVSN